MGRETEWFVENLNNRQARFLLRLLEEDESDHQEKQAVLRAALQNRSPINGPQSALAYIINNRCPSETGALKRYIGLFPSEPVIDHLIENRIRNVGSAEAVIDDLLALFAASAVTYEKFKTRSGFSAAAARQINNVGAMLYHGAKKAAARYRGAI